MRAWRFEIALRVHTRWMHVYLLICAHVHVNAFYCNCIHQGGGGTYSVCRSIYTGLSVSTVHYY